MTPEIDEFWEYLGEFQLSNLEKTSVEALVIAHTCAVDPQGRYIGAQMTKSVAATLVSTVRMLASFGVHPNPSLALKWSNGGMATAA